MSNPLISVIIPCYNQGQFLHSAINSVLAQDYPQIEIIIINDGSTDPKTQSILKDFTTKKEGGGERQHPYLKIFTIKNRGLSGARNYGLTKATGDFIQFLDTDDELLPQKFTRQLQHFSQNPKLDISYTKFYYQRGTKKTFLPKEAMTITDPIKDFLFRWETSLTLPPHVFLFKSKCFNNYRFHSNLFSCEDWVLWSELALAGYQLQFLDFTGAIYHQHENNMTKKREQMYLANILATAHLRNLISHNHSLLAAFDQAAITRLKYVFYQYFQDEFIKNNPDRQELNRIKSTLPFKLWQKYGHLIKKLGVKF